jgi:hypothetical protein
VPEVVGVPESEEDNPGLSTIVLFMISARGCVGEKVENTGLCENHQIKLIP